MKGSPMNARKIPAVAGMTAILILIAVTLATVPTSRATPTPGCARLSPSPV